MAYCVQVPPKQRIIFADIFFRYVFRKFVRFEIRGHPLVVKIESALSIGRRGASRAAFGPSIDFPGRRLLTMLQFISIKLVSENTTVHQLAFLSYSTKLYLFLKIGIKYWAKQNTVILKNWIQHYLNFFYVGEDFLVQCLKNLVERVPQIILKNGSIF